MDSKIIKLETQYSGEEEKTIITIELIGIENSLHLGSYKDIKFIEWK